MKIKAIILLILLVVSLIAVSCKTTKNCGGMRHHNDDVRRGLAH